MASEHCVVVGDVIDSRKVEDREQLRRRLETGIARANDAVRNALAAPFEILKGVDELAGVLAGPATAYRAMRELTEAIHPAEIRFAVIWGTVDVGADASTVAAMDGPAFHRADESLARVERKNRYVSLAIGSSPGVFETLLEDLIELVLRRKDEWTERQTELVERYRELDSMTAVAEAEGVSTQAVSKGLSRADARRIGEIETDITAAFEQLDREVR